LKYRPYRRGVIAIAFSLLAGATVAQSQQPQGGPPPNGQRRGPPFDKIAQDLGIPADRVRAAFDEVGPPPRGPDGPPTEQQLAQHAQKLAAAMNVPVEKLEPVLRKYRPPGPPPRQ
jgi:hypothetical protein